MSNLSIWIAGDVDARLKSEVEAALKDEEDSDVNSS